MISTGTDIKPLACLIFMKDVKSRVYFEQMKGRGTRVISSTGLNAVTGDAYNKTQSPTQAQIKKQVKSWPRVLVA